MKERMLFALTMVIVFSLAALTVMAWYDNNYLYRRTWDTGHSSETSILVAINSSSGYDTATPIAAGKMQNDCDDFAVKDLGDILQ